MGVTRPSAVLFDVDGTLVDHEGASAAAIRGTDIGALDPDGVVGRWRVLEDAAMDRYLAGELTFAEQRRARVAALALEYGFGEWDDARADAWFAGYLRAYEAAWRAYPDAAPALAALRRGCDGPRIGVLTNGDAAQQRAKLAAVGLADVLDPVLASSDLGAAKPDPRIFAAACAALSLPSDQVVYVGDRLATDAVAAARAGLRGVWLDRSGGDDPPEDGPPRIESLTELPALLAAES